MAMAMIQSQLALFSWSRDMKQARVVRETRPVVVQHRSHHARMSSSVDRPPATLGEAMCELAALQEELEDLNREHRLTREYLGEANTRLSMVERERERMAREWVPRSVLEHFTR
jgi:hypothetical protein